MSPNKVYDDSSLHSIGSLQKTSQQMSSFDQIDMLNSSPTRSKSPNQIEMLNSINLSALGKYATKAQLNSSLDKIIVNHNQVSSKHTSLKLNLPPKINDFKITLQNTDRDIEEIAGSGSSSSKSLEIRA